MPREIASLALAWIDAADWRGVLEHMNFRRWLLRGPVLVAMTLAICACKGDDPKRVPPSPPAAVTPLASSDTPSTGVTDTEVVLGEPAAFSGPSSGLGIEMWRGATAAFSAANEKGIHGRKIRLVVADDAYDAEKAAGAVAQLVEHDHVFALFGGVGTPTIVRALPLVRKYNGESGLFYFADFTGAQPQRVPPNAKAVFNVRASYYEEARAIVDVFVRGGKQKIGVLAQDDAYGADGRAGVEKALAARGLTMASDVRYPRGQKFEDTMKPQLDVLRGAGVDAVVGVTSYQAAAAFVRDARSAGWNVPIHNVSFVGADQMLEVLRETEKKTGLHLATNLINTQVVPHYNDTSVALVRQYRNDMDRSQPTAPAPFGAGPYQVTSKYTFGSLEGYVSARLFLAILEKVGRDVSRSAFTTAAETTGPFDIGLGVAAEFSPTRHQAFDKVWFTYVTPDGWTSIDDPVSKLK